MFTYPQIADYRINPMNQNLQTPVPCRALSSAGLTRNGHPRKRKPLTPEQRQKKRARDAEYSRKNKDRKSAYQKAYYGKNKIEALLFQNAYYIKNKAAVKANTRKYYRENKAESLEYQRQYRIANRAAISARQKVYAKENPDIISRNGRLRYIRKKGVAIGNTGTIAGWERFWRKQKRVSCYWCGLRVAGKKAHMDHIIALAKGGSHSIENLCISCSNCNQRKNAKTLEQWNASLAQPVLL